MEVERADPGLLDAIENVLKELVGSLKDEANTKVGRPRVLPNLALWTGMLVCVARGFSSQLELWRQLMRAGLWDYPRYELSDEAVYKRLKNSGADTFLDIFKKVTALLNQRRGTSKERSKLLAGFAAGVYALDEMTLDAVKKRLPSIRNIEGAVLPGKITGLFDVRNQIWHALEFQELPRQNEKVAARGMLKYIPAGSLVLADLGYFGFEWFDELTDKGYYWTSRLRGKTSYSVLRVLHQSDGILDAIVWLGAYRADKAAHAVPLVIYTKGDRTWSYITNVLQPARLSIREIAQIYARRWDIEMMFNMLKTHLKLHVLWSSQLNVVLHQVYSVFTVAQVILGIRSDIAEQTNADVFEISMDLLIRWLPRFAKEGKDPIKMLVELGRGMLIIRPSSRTVISAPEPPLTDYDHLPDDTVLTRSPRYAQKA